jgi:hypothetical protein
VGVRGSGFDFVGCGFYAKSEAEENLQVVAVCELNTIAVKGGKKKEEKVGGWVGGWVETLLGQWQKTQLHQGQGFFLMKKKIRSF